jgi:hypothetical protein
MANTFSGDSNCYAVWNFESGALTTDSKSTNTLTNYQTVAEETGDYKQGSCCASFDGGSRQLYRADTDLSAGFPLKSGDTNKKISVVFWIYLLALPEASQSFYIVDKYGVAGNTRSLGISVYNNAGTYELRVRFGITSGTSSELWTAFSGLAIYTWYHIGITYDDAAKGYTGVLWDTTPTAHKHVLTAGNITNNISITTADWCISGIPDRNSSFANMRLDECVVFNDILSGAEIDAIRGGTYAVSAATPINATPSDDANAL